MVILEKDADFAPRLGFKLRGELAVYIYIYIFIKKKKERERERHILVLHVDVAAQARASHGTLLFSRGRVPADGSL